jgi:hypothetical protein
MTLLAFEDQVRPPAPFEAEVGSPAVSAREKDLAEALLDSATSDFDLTRYRDDYAAKLARLVQQKTRRKIGKSRPAGAAVGDLVVGRWVSEAARRRIVPVLFVLVGVPLVPLAWGPSTPVTLALFALASAATAYQLGGQQAFLEAVPEDRRGLAFGLYGTGLMTGQGLGPVAAGGLADLVGAATTITVLGGLVLVAAPFLARLPSRRD